MSRQRISAARLAWLAGGLSETDWAVLNTLARLRVATGGQLTRLHFAKRPNAARQARRVLAALTSDRLVCRLERTIGGIRAGSASYVYALDVAGQRLVGLPARRPRTPGTAFLAHALAVAELYVGLRDAEQAGALELLDYLAEPACWRDFAGPGGARLICKPDASSVIGLGEFSDRWFLEVDRATEGRAALQRQASVYVRYWQSGREQAAHGVFPRVLWIVPHEARKAVLVDVLARLPSEVWPLFQVVTEDAALRVLSGGRP